MLATITQLVHDLGVTVLLAEHRLERVVHFADRMAYLPGDGTVQLGPPAEVLATTAIAPPPAKRQLATLVQDLATAGHGVAIATHDVEFVAQAADRVVVLADGEVVADGPTAEVVISSPAFAPQVAKVLAPEPWLTVDQVSEALRRAPA